MWIFLALGLALCVIGGMLLFSPEILHRFDRLLNRVLFEDKSFYQSRVLLSIVIILGGLVMLYTYYQYGLLLSPKAK